MIAGIIYDSRCGKSDVAFRTAATFVGLLVSHTLRFLFRRNCKICVVVFKPFFLVLAESGRNKEFEESSVVDIDRRLSLSKTLADKYQQSSIHERYFATTRIVST